MLGVVRLPSTKDWVSDSLLSIHTGQSDTRHPSTLNIHEEDTQDLVKDISVGF
jgi:hypothetical protein